MIAGLVATAGAPQTPLNVDQQRQIGCVATLAIVASEQTRGRASEWPALQARGARFAQVVGERVMKEAGWTKEQVRDAILASVAARQAQTKGASADLPDNEVRDCIAMMDAQAPAPPPPTLPQCAAMVTAAYEEVRARDGQTAGAKDLKTIASVLHYRAREALRAKGMSGSEVDREMAQTREAIAAEAKRRVADDVSAGLDYSPCLEMARP
ncbi:hypothetical protein D3876_09005 [Sphingomonas cavernae]|uniref:Uncharacterized protein n=1 Tax=Sphingomonas cavernae TaxID=2320861 RepID=A0A418WK11_9SPHN|nr:hypothetical protein D3876_09005 [Sphingomonas cavernae]